MKAGPNYNFVYQVTEESFLDVVVGNNFLVANNALKIFIYSFIHSFTLSSIYSYDYYL